jgi:hypothetical protein
MFSFIISFAKECSFAIIFFSNFKIYFKILLKNLFVATHRVFQPWFGVQIVKMEHMQSIDRTSRISQI